MYTQCPECLTVYSINAQALAQGHGSVVCAHCTAIFDALRTLADAKPADASPMRGPTQGQDLPRLAMPVMRPAVVNAPAGSKKVTAVPTPGFARLRQMRPGLPNWMWLAGIAILLPLLIAQVAYAERNEVLRSAALPWLKRACAAIACTLPLPRDVDELVLLSRDVRPHPSVPNALIISATLRNDADYAQAFPIVEITLADLDEHRIAMRRFRPTEYIGDPRTIATGLGAHASSALVFEVADPGKNAVAYEFKFL